MIPVYWISVNGEAGPCEDTIKGVLDNVETELEEQLAGGSAKIIKIEIGEMLKSEYNELPEFEGY